MRSPRRSRRVSRRFHSPEFMDLEPRLVLSSAGTPASDIGVNLNGNSPWAGDPVWVDVRNLFNAWGPVNNVWATSPAPPVNSDNYPLAPASTMAVLANYPAGLYQLSYEGTGTLTFSGMGKLVGSITTSNGVSTGTVELNPAFGTTNLFLTLTGVSSTATISNFHLYAPGYGANPTQVFTNQFLQAVKPFTTVRFMNWMATNGSTVANWSDRTPPTSFLATTASGVPYEDMIALANEAQKNMWINIPALATPTYVQDLAQLIQANLDPNLKVYVEYSNETWNSGFLAYGQVLTASLSNPLVTATNNLDKVAEQSAYMAIQDGQIFKTVFGAGNTQVVPVFSGWSYGYWYQQAALQWVQATYGSPANYFSDLAIAPYIGLPSGTNVSSLNVNQVFAGLNQTLNTSYVSQLQTSASIASTYGISLAAYEGGQSMGSNNSWSYSVMEQAKNDPRMYQLYVSMMQDWDKYVGTQNVFMDYLLSGSDSQYGFWGLLPSVASVGSQEYDALVSMMYPAGDADMDGVVGANDVQTVLGNLGMTGAWWSQGVFNDSGVVDWNSVNSVKTNLDPQLVSLAQFAQLAVSGAPSTLAYQQTADFNAYGATYLSDMAWVSSYSGQGSVQRDQSSLGRQINVGGSVYAKGLGTFANSQVVVNLNGQYSQFQSTIGIDNWYNPALVDFQVYGDGKLLYNSGTISSWSGGRPIDVNVAGVNQLTLDVVAAGTSNTDDYADWGAARLISTANFGSATPYSVSYSLSLNGKVLTTQSIDSFMFANLQDGLYTITATATNPSGASASASTTLEVGPTGPGLVYTIPGNGQVQVEWGPGWGDSTYDLYRGTSPTSLSLIATDVNGTSYIDKGLSNGTTYYYAVAGVDGLGNPGPQGTTFQAMPTVLVTGDTYVSNMPFLSASNGSGAVQRDTSDVPVQGASWYRPLLLRWQPVTKGLGVQANSMIAIATNGAYATFKTTIGIDSMAGPGGSVVFMIRNGLGQTLYTSPVMTPSSPPISIVVPVTGAQVLMLYTTATSSNNRGDYADWGNARLVPVGLTYASDLPFSSSYNGSTPVVRNGSDASPAYPNGGPMIMNGATYLKGLGVGAFSVVQFNLAGAFSTLDFTAGFDQVAGANPLPVSFAIETSNSYYGSSLITAGSAPIPVSFSLAGAQWLKLIVYNDGPANDGFYNQYFDWGLVELWK